MPLRPLALVALFFTLGTAQAEEPADAGSSAEQFEAQLHYQTGSIALPGGKARLEVSPAFRYLDPKDAARVLEEAWGNPAGDETLGMLLPADASPLSEQGWGVIISYEEDGHVSDEDADAIDYTEMMEQMKQSAIEENPARREQGYEEVSVVGWAEPPFYEKSTRKLYWAKELQFGDSAQHTLNYNIRVLGREGVLNLNAVAGIEQLPMIKSRVHELIAIADFTPGNTYAEYDASTDKVAAYGLAALVGGAVAAKTGLIAKLIALLIVGKKFVIIAVIALVAGLRKLFGGGKRV